jgi:hypothetical protein
VRAADQFLFGYDDGHRLLTGSRELEPDTAAALLRASDAAMVEGSQPLVTGLALLPREQYAFCVTWSANELPRPGAVWAHALIVDAQALSDARAVEVLTGLPRRPAGGRAGFAGYRETIALDTPPPAAPSYLPPGPPDPSLLERLARAAYGSESERTVAHDALADAAKAAIALWRAQWGSLRARFCFRTREIVRGGASEFDLTVTRRIRDHGSPSEQPATAEPWLAGIAADAGASAPTPLRDWLLAFGPFEPSEPRRLAALAALWPLVVARDGQATRAQLARDWPGALDGAQLKQVLFAPENDDWWSGAPL